MRVAAVSWEIRPVQSLNEFLGHMDDLVAYAARQGSDLIVLPESIDLERTSYTGFRSSEDIPYRMAADAPAVFEHIRQLSQTYEIVLLGGCHLRESQGKIINSAVIAEHGVLRFQDKNILTQWEVNEWKIEPGQGLVPFLDDKAGCLVCYDSEFAPACRTLAENGAKVLCVPAFNETIRGFHRVRWSCHARTVEFQVYVVHAALVGSLGREPVPTTHGSSAILCPSVLPMPESGILAETQFNLEGVAVADIDLDLIEVARNSDDVRNWNDRDLGEWKILSSNP